MVGVKLRLRLRPANGLTWEEAVGRIIDTEDMRPHTIIVGSDHAQAVEFGTNPARPNGSRRPGEVSKVEAEIREWVGRKLGLTGAERDRRAHAIYRSIMENGMAPQPYARPAMYSVLDDIRSGAYDGELTVRGVAEAIASRMEEILTINDTIFKGELISSIRVEEARDGMSTTIDDSLMDDPYAGANGRRPPQRYRRWS